MHHSVLMLTTLESTRKALPILARPPLKVPMARKHFLVSICPSTCLRRALPAPKCTVAETNVGQKGRVYRRRLVDG